MKVLNIKHSGNSGDIVYALSGIKAVCEKYGAQARLFLWLDRPAFYYEGATHPVENAKGKNVMLNRYMFDMLKPLLDNQPYIESVNPWEGEKINIDMDRIREVNVGIPYGDIRRWYFYLFPDMCTDLCEPSIMQEFVLPPEPVKDMEYILVNRTQRYNNVRISYAFLRDYPTVLFAGTPTEFELFAHEVPNAIHVLPKDFLELSEYILFSKLFVGNQSMCYAIAEQMKRPRVLETCAYAPNVIPAGPDGYDFYTQTALEYYVEKLWKGETP